MRKALKSALVVGLLVLATMALIMGPAFAAKKTASDSNSFGPLKNGSGNVSTYGWDKGGTDTGTGGNTYCSHDPFFGKTCAP